MYNHKQWTFQILHTIYSKNVHFYTMNIVFLSIKWLLSLILRDNHHYKIHDYQLQQKHYQIFKIKFTKNLYKKPQRDDLCLLTKLNLDIVLEFQAIYKNEDNLLCTLSVNLILIKITLIFYVYLKLFDYK